MALLAEETARSTTPVTSLDRSSVRDLEHFHFAPEDIRWLGRNIPWSGSWSAAWSIDIASAVRHERPRRFPFLRERLDFVLEDGQKREFGYEIEIAGQMESHVRLKLELREHYVKSR